MAIRIRLIVSLLLLALPARGADLVEALPVTDQILVLHFSDGYVDHHGLGEQHWDDVVVADALDLAVASAAASYVISSTGDAAYATAREPVRVGRKSKGSDFTTRYPDLPYVRDHWIYLELPEPMQSGQTYVVGLEALETNVDEIVVTYDHRTTRSETIHVNNLGYVPSAPKYAYLSHWMGDLGPLALDQFDGEACTVIAEESGDVVFTGEIRLRKRLIDAAREVAQTNEPGNMSRTDVWECDFTALTVPGTYRVSIAGIGASFPFEIDPDVYREAFVATARGLYHQRCGIALEQPYTEWTKPRCHHPAETDTVMLSTWRHMDGTNAFTQLPQGATGERRPLWGGWHDAGDWDRREPHLNVPYQLLLAYELAPSHFTDGELNIPESGNGVPDVIDEARWGVDFFRRLQEEDGGVRGGIETTGHPAPGVASFTDDAQWYAYGPEPKASYHYAAVAAQLAHALRMVATDAAVADAEGYLASAERAYAWSGANMRAGDEPLVRDDRQLAAAWLYKTTGDAAYQTQFAADNQIDSPTEPLVVWQEHDQDRAVWTYVTTDRPDIDPALKQRLTAAALNWASVNNLQTAAVRAFRFGYDIWRPTGWGAMTTPDALPLMVAHHLTKDPKYLEAQYLAADFYLGANPLNMTWVSGLAERHPEEILHLDSWYTLEDRPVVPGLTPYGPHRYHTAAVDGPWNERWGFTTTYPPASQWPTHELWFENRHAAPTNEYTVMETIAPSAAAYGYLTAATGSGTGRDADRLREQGFLLDQNFPNPFSRTTEIAVTVLRPSQVVLEVFDVLGRRVATLLDDELGAGERKRVTFDRAGLATGVYFYRAEVGERSETRKMVVR